MSEKVKDAELLKSALAVSGVKLVENPELLRVTTISAKLVEQMPQFDTAEYTESEVNRQWWKAEILGVSEKHYAIIARDEGGKIGKIRPLNFLMYLRTTQHMDLEAAQGVLRALPQLFEV